jgi:hypothetical protein
VSELITRELRYERLVSGDRPSILALGVYGAESIKKTMMAVFMVDALGRIHVMPPGAVQVLSAPRVLAEDLDTMTEEQAISVMTAQGDGDEVILAYLSKRSTREGTRDGSEGL